MITLRTCPTSDKRVLSQKLEPLNQTTTEDNHVAMWGEARMQHGTVRVEKRKAWPSGRWAQDSGPERLAKHPHQRAKERAPLQVVRATRRLARTSPHGDGHGRRLSCRRCNQHLASTQSECAGRCPRAPPSYPASAGGDERGCRRGGSARSPDPLSRPLPRPHCRARERHG